MIQRIFLGGHVCDLTWERTQAGPLTQAGFMVGCRHPINHPYETLGFGTTEDMALADLRREFFRLLSFIDTSPLPEDFGQDNVPTAELNQTTPYRIRER